ncbi:MAG: adenylosuccinate synthetase, partial [Pseudomonadota bacterium]
MSKKTLNEELSARYGKNEVIAVVCNQWGDTGKGAIVDRFMSIANICVRSTGGDNCGHTVEANGHKYVTHMIPSGIIFDSQGVVSVIARDVAFNPLTARLELEEFARNGITHNNLKISFRAKLIMPYHILLDMLSEKMSAKGKKIGTTGRGIGPVFQDHVARTGLIVMDMRNLDVMRAKLHHILRDKIALLKTLDSEMVKEVMMHERLESGRFYDSKNVLNIDAIADRYYEHGHYFQDMICDTEDYLKKQLGRTTMVFEGAQGTLLDINQGTYPFVTSSCCTTAGLMNGAGLHERDVTQSLGVVKAYVTRVGEGSFPTEIGGYNAVNIYKADLREKLKDVPLIDQMNDFNEIIQGGAIGMKGNEFGATTGRPRRVGWQDAVALRYAVGINGPKIVITKLDILTGVKELKICTGYYYDGPDNRCVPVFRGKTLDTMIPENEILQHCRPRYEIFEGWD